MENIPFTRVSRGNRVKKKMQFKVDISLAKRQNLSFHSLNKFIARFFTTFSELFSKVRDRVRDFGQKWNKIEMVIPTGMKYRSRFYDNDQYKHKYKHKYKHYTRCTTVVGLIQMSVPLTDYSD